MTTPCAECKRILTYKGEWHKFTGAAPCAECKNFLVYKAGWHELAGAISPSLEALIEFKKEYSKEIEEWEKTGSSGSLSIYLIDRNDREYESLTRQEIERCAKKGVFIL